ncbi:Superoxide dismutase [Mn] 1 [bioreactor metagenome]|uniref:superoxide dismutase n=1 Tax=bioreactor metagenome TaxID=1076179 RepID=A0A644YRT5_9ZZZZ
MYSQILLPYAFDALEPHIDALTMETHYSKHHAAYTKNLNEAVEKAGLAGRDIVALLSSLREVPDEALRKTIHNNGGGFYNHNLYFGTMSPSGGGTPEGSFGRLLERQFGSFSALQEELGRLAVAQFGSGWAWLSAGRDGALSLSASANQDNPLMEPGAAVPILGIDVWEHAYYLKYKNLRADYINAFFQVVDWRAVAENYEKVISR